MKILIRHTVATVSKNIPHYLSLCLCTHCVQLFLLKIALLCCFVVYNEFDFRIFRYLLFEIILFEYIFLYQSVVIKGIFGIFLFVHIFQLINIFSTGQYIETETLLNLNTYASLSRDELIKNGVLFCVLVILWLPSVFRKGIIKGTKPVVALIVIFCISCVFLPRLPFRNFADKAIQAYTIYTFKTSPALKKVFLNNSVAVGPSILDYNGYNIIVIFAEGTSQCVISEQLTPFLHSLAQKSLLFKNYFGHTAPTFRGIRGQLMSGYQFKGGYYSDGTGLGQISSDRIKNTISDNINLNSILKRYGYATAFVSPHAAQDPFTHFLKYIGFDKIFLYGNSSISDKELYKHLGDEIINLHKSGEKFFVSTYVLGTHHGQDSPDLKYGDGKNSYLNKFYNQDYWFGKFFSRLYAAGVFKNTILVFTTDHATYPSNEFRKTFQSNVPYFIDRIPLYFYTENITPQIVDAHNRNSLCMAPTLLNIVGIKDEPNYFLGESLFSDKNNVYSHISNIGYEYFDISSGVVRPFEPPREIKKNIDTFMKIFG